MTVRYKTIGRVSAETGYTEHAIRTKIRDGVWPEGDVWIKAPDGRILISVEGYHKWVENELEFPLPQKAASRYRSSIAANGVERKSNSSPPPLT